MPRVFRPTDKDVNAPQEQPKVTTAGAGTITASTPPSGSAATPNAPSKSGSFTNLKDYLSANKNFNKEGGGLAGSIVSDVAKQGEQVKSDVSSAVSGVKDSGQGQVTAAQTGAGIVAPPTATPPVAPVVAPPSPTQSTTQRTPAPSRDSRKFAPSTNVVTAASTFNPSEITPEQTQAIQTALGTTYTGPTTIQSEEIANKAAKIAELASLTGDEANRKTLLQQYVKSPTYSSGQQTLDNLFLQADPEAQKKLAELGNISSDVSGAYQQGISESEALAKGYQNIIDKSKADILKTLELYGTNLGTGISSSIPELEKQRTEIYNDALGRLSDGSISAEDAQVLGLPEGSNLYGVDISKLAEQIIRKNTTPVSLSNVITSDQSADLAALKNIIGGYSNETINNILNTYGNLTPTELGSAYNVDEKTLSDAVGISKANYENKYNYAEGNVTSAQANINNAKNAINDYVNKMGGIDNVDPMSPDWIELNSAVSKYNTDLVNAQRGVNEINRDYGFDPIYNIGGSLTIDRSNVGSGITPIEASQPPLLGGLPGDISPDAEPVYGPLYDESGNLIEVGASQPYDNMGINTQPNSTTFNPVGNSRGGSTRSSMSNEGSNKQSSSKLLSGNKRGDSASIRDYRPIKEKPKAPPEKTGPSEDGKIGTITSKRKALKNIMNK